jgi:predicted DNA-binding transcriptional regulator AlpA
MARVLPITPVAVPGLDEVVTDPSRATALPRGTLQALLHRCVAAQTILLGALTAGEPDKGNGEPDRLLDVEAAAQRLGMSKDWLYRHAKQLPFRVLQGRLLRFSSHGIDRYIRTRQNRMPA